MNYQYNEEFVVSVVNLFRLGRNTFEIAEFLEARPEYLWMKESTVYNALAQREGKNVPSS